MSKEALAKAQAIRKALNKAANSDVLQVWNSDLYDWSPGVRATLIVIAFAQMTSEDSHYPDDAPDNFKANKIGWCWLSQESISKRVGKGVDQVYRDIRQFCEDAVIEKRTWIDSYGTHHAEYHILEDVIAAHQRVKDAPRPKRNSRVYKSNRGSFKTDDGRARGKQKKASVMDQSHSASQPSPRYLSTIDHATSQPSSRTTPQPKDDGWDSSVGRISVRSGSSSLQDDNQPVPLSAGREAASPRFAVLTPESQGQRQRDSAARPQGILTSGAKPLPNWRCYPDAFPPEKYNPKTGEWKGLGGLPKCNRCGGTLYPQENHDCPGYIPPHERHTAVVPMRVTKGRASAFDDFDDDHYQPEIPIDDRADCREDDVPEEMES